MLVRVPEVGAYLSRSLDMGAAGVVVPRVDSRDQAAAAVSAVRFPPAGARGIGGARAAGYGLAMEGYRGTADGELLLVLMVETRAGLDNVAEIAAVDGVDVIFVGPVDLASSLGVPAGGQEHSAAIRTIIDTALAARRHVGILCADAEEAHRYAALGARLLLISVDAVVLAGAFADLFGRARPAGPSPT